MNNVVNEVWKRRLIVIANDSDFRNLEHTDDGITLLNSKSTTVISINDAEEFFTSQFNILGYPRPESGMFLVISPYNDNSYVNIEDAQNIIAIEKANLAIHLCYLLGAKSIAVKNIRLVDYEKKTNFELDVVNNVHGGKLNANIKNSKLLELKNKLNTQAVFSGSKPQVDEAIKFLEVNRLSSDPLLKRVVMMVKDSESIENNIDTITEDISLTESLNRTFELVSNLKLPVGLVTANYDSIVKEKTELFIRVEIKF